MYWSIFFRYEVLGILSMATMMGNNPRRMMRTKFGYMENPYRYMVRMNRGTQGWRGIKRFVAKARYKTRKNIARSLVGIPKVHIKNGWIIEDIQNGHLHIKYLCQRNGRGSITSSRPLEPKLETTGISQYLTTLPGRLQIIGGSCGIKQRSRGGRRWRRTLEERKRNLRNFQYLGSG